MRSGAQFSKTVLWPHVIARSVGVRTAAITVGALVAMLLAACTGQPGRDVLAAPADALGAGATADHAATPASGSSRSAAKGVATRVPVPRLKPARAASAEAEPRRLVSPAPRVFRETLRVRLDAVDLAEHRIAAAWPAPAAGPPDAAPILVWPSPARPNVAAGGGIAAKALTGPDGVAGGGAPSEAAAAPDGAAGSGPSARTGVPAVIWPSPARPDVAAGTEFPSEGRTARDGPAGSDATVLADVPAVIWPAPVQADVAAGTEFPSERRAALDGTAGSDASVAADLVAPPDDGTGSRTGIPSEAVAVPRVEPEDGEQTAVAEVADGAGISVSRGLEPEGEALAQVVWVTDRTEDLRAASRAAGEALRAGQPARALVIYQEILKLLPGERSTLLGAAAALRQLGRAAEAEHIYRLLLRKNPRDRFVETALWGLLGEREPQAALAQLRRLAWQDPDDGRVRAQIGLILARQGQLDRAIAELQVALRLDPANARYRADLRALREAIARGPRAADGSDPIRALAPTHQ